MLVVAILPHLFGVAAMLPDSFGAVALDELV